LRFAERRGVSRTTRYQRLNEERPTTSDTAARPALALGKTPRFWLKLQANYGAWHGERDSRKLKIDRLYEVKYAV